MVSVMLSSANSVAVVLHWSMFHLVLAGHSDHRDMFRYVSLMRSAADESLRAERRAGERNKTPCLTYSQFNVFAEKDLHYLA